MTKVLAVVRSADRAAVVTTAAQTYARQFGGRVTVLVTPDGRDAVAGTVPPDAPVHVVEDRDLPAAVRAELVGPATWLLVAAGPLRDGESALERMLPGCRRPVLVVPPGVDVEACRAVSRVLVPLDGSAESSAAADRVLVRFAGTGVDLVVVHVFGGEDVPAFWDQRVHAERSWGEEFLARNLPVGVVVPERVELRTGDPARQIVDAARTNAVDLVTLGWSCDLSEDRAAVVRATTTLAGVPVMLVPVEDGSGDG